LALDAVYYSEDLNVVYYSKNLSVMEFGTKFHLLLGKLKRDEIEYLYNIENESDIEN
jgi:hypothetical protein